MVLNKMETMKNFLPELVCYAGEIGSTRAKLNVWYMELGVSTKRIQYEQLTENCW